MSAYSDLILAHPDLVGYWRLGDVSGDAIDAKGSLDGSVTGATMGAAGAIFGDADTAYSFDGSDGVLIPNDASTQLTTGSLELWLEASSGDGWVAAKHLAFGIYLWGGDPGWFDWGGSGVHDSNVPTTDGNWHHLVLTFQSGVSSGALLYKDGALIYTGQMTVLGNLTAGLGIGSDYSDGSTPDSGVTATLDEVALYSSVLTPEVIAAHHDMGVNGPPAETSDSKIIMPLGARRRRR